MSKPSVFAVAYRFAPSIKSAILLEAGDIQFSRVVVVVVRTFLARAAARHAFSGSHYLKLAGCAIRIAGNKWRGKATRAHAIWRCNEAISCPGFFNPGRSGRLGPKKGTSRARRGGQITKLGLRKAASPYTY